MASRSLLLTPAKGAFVLSDFSMSLYIFIVVNRLPYFSRAIFSYSPFQVACASVSLSARARAQFDRASPRGGRQKMALEDQLLQNRISTDSALSKTYQDTLQSRAQGLASQWNQNTGIYFFSMPFQVP